MAPSQGPRHGKSCLSWPHLPALWPPPSRGHYTRLVSFPRLLGPGSSCSRSCFLLSVKTKISSVAPLLGAVSFSFTGTQKCEFPVTHHHSLSEQRLLLCKPTFGK